MLAKPTIEDAKTLYETGQLRDAAQVCSQLLTNEPMDARVLTLLGAIAFQTGTAQEALTLLSRAVELDDGQAFTHNLMGNAQHAAGAVDKALVSYGHALALSPRYVDAYYNRGCTLLDLGKLEDAIRDFDQAITLDPTNAGAYQNRGIALAGAGRLKEAITSLDQAIATAPGQALSYYNRGRACQDMLRFEEAVADYDAAIAIDPRYAAAYVNRAISLLTLGRLEEGWSDFEWRWASGGSLLATERRHFRQPQWQGEKSIEGQTILLHSEQGLGDTLQFCRYAALVAALGATVIFEAPRPLRTLLSSLAGVHRLISSGEDVPDSDWHCPLMSLPSAFRTSLASIPAQTPYIKSERIRVDRWERMLGPKRSLRVGLVWSGGFRPDRSDLWAINSRRNMPLEEFAPLNLPDVEFFSLQKGQPAEGEYAKLAATGWIGPAIRDVSAHLQDFADTAALIELLDVVISVDTSVAHLAGALNKPVWILNRYDSCWRWMRRRESPWYPSARLLWQRTPGDWSEPIEEARTALLALAASVA